MTYSQLEEELSEHSEIYAELFAFGVAKAQYQQRHSGKAKVEDAKDDEEFDQAVTGRMRQSDMNLNSAHAALAKKYGSKAIGM